MNPGVNLTVGLGAASLAAAIGAWAWSRFIHRRKPDAAELERLRRLAVNRRGRITAGRIVDLLEPEAPELASRLVLYKYEVGGVTYEAAQDVSALPEIAPPARCLAGQTASVKYDPKKPTNSIIACEAWCGLPEETAESGVGESETEEKMLNGEL